MPGLTDTCIHMLASQKMKASRHTTYAVPATALNIVDAGTVMLERIFGEDTCNRSGMNKLELVMVGGVCLSLSGRE